MRILIVDDELRVANLIAKGLSAEGYSTVLATSGEEAVRIVLDGEVDLVILDIMMPVTDGLSVLRDIRSRRTDLPVIMLTVRDDVSSKVACFDAGADDYVVKPFSFQELFARVRAQFRDRSSPDSFTLTAGELELDLKTHEVIRRGRRIPLSSTEFGLLELFFRHPRQVLTRSQILDHVWGYDYGGVSNVVDVYVGYLRRKVGLNHGSPRLETVRGSGYRLEVISDSDEPAT